jgi:hypothetical protein
MPACRRAVRASASCWPAAPTVEGAQDRVQQRFCPRVELAQRSSASLEHGTAARR